MMVPMQQNSLSISWVADNIFKLSPVDNSLWALIFLDYRISDFIQQTKKNNYFMSLYGAYFPTTSNLQKHASRKRLNLQPNWGLFALN